MSLKLSEHKIKINIAIMLFVFFLGGGLSVIGFFYLNEMPDDPNH